MSRLDNHVSTYGKYRVALSQEWGVKNGVDPISYTDIFSEKAQSIKTLNSYVNRIVGNCDTKAALNNAIIKLCVYTKALSGIMQIKNNDTHTRFYEESEWRYVPDLSKLDVPVIYDDPANKELVGDANIKTRRHMLKLKLCDILFVFVESEKDVVLLEEFIGGFNDHSLGDVRLLKTRITNYDHLRKIL